MTGTEALMKAIEVSPVMNDIWKAGIIDVAGHDKDIHLTSETFHSLFSQYEKKAHSPGRVELCVDWHGYRIFCLENATEDDGDSVETGAA